MKRSRPNTLTHAPASEHSRLRHEFHSEVADVLRNARVRAYRAVNVTMVEAYWNIGRLIVEKEQSGQKRADYAAFLIPNLATRLTREFGKGYGEANLRNFRQFYLTFPSSDSEAIRYTVCSELTWSRYRALMRVVTGAGELERERALLARDAAA